MAFHELCTNALKYGALSVPEGRVAVLWTVAKNNVLSIEWQERDGPPVDPPEKNVIGIIRHRSDFSFRHDTTRNSFTVPPLRSLTQVSV